MRSPALALMGRFSSFWQWGEQMRADIHNLIVARLREAVPAVAGRVWDGSAPEDAAFPHIVIGDEQAVMEDTDCIEASRVTLTIHIWASARPDLTQCREVTQAAKGAFQQWEPPLADVRWIAVHTTRVFPDRDPNYAHGVVTVEALLEG